jgi:hypothetical protein
VVLEQGPLSILSTTEKLLEIKSSCSGLESRKITAVGIRQADHVACSIRKKLALTSPTSGGHSAGIVRSQTKATEFVLLFVNSPLVSNVALKFG